MSETLTFDKRSAKVRATLGAVKGELAYDVERDAPQAQDKEGKDLLSLDQLRESILIDMPSAVKQLDAMRQGSDGRVSVDLNLGEYAKQRWGFAPADSGSPDALYKALGLNPAKATVSSLMQMPDFDEGYRWLLPEVIREAVRLGIRKPPIYTNLIAAEQNVSQPSVIMPSILLSDAMPTKIGETETIPVGMTSFEEKTVRLQKFGTGLKITDEVQNFVPLNILSIYLQDVGVKMNIGLDTLAVDTLINGDQAGGSAAAAVIGVNNTTTGFTYFDLLRAWIRMGMLGRLPQSILSNEAPALDILMLDEFRSREYLLNPQSLNLRTPVPQTTNYDIHGAMPSASQIMLIDATAALVKLNAVALRVESERIASRQITGTYVTMTTGFANLFNDARLIIDESVAFSSQGFPAYMNPYASISQAFKR